MEIKSSRAFSLIEVLVSLLIIMILVSSVYSLINFSLQITADNKNNVQAISIANEKLEQIRTLPYDEIQITGIVDGVLDETYEEVIRNGKFDVYTSVIYVDDPYDGIQNGTDSTFFADYKKVTVRVSWSSRNETKSVTMFSNIIPATEETSSGNGILEIIVVNADGVPVSGATVHIVNPNVGTIADNITDSSGVFSYSPAEPGYEAYEVTVSKSGYSTERTYSRIEITNPTKPNLTVNIGSKTQEGFTIDLLGQLNIKTVSGVNLPHNYIANSSSGDQLNPAIDVFEDNSYVVWQDERNGDSEIYLQEYNSTGVKQLSSSDVVISSSGINRSPDIKKINDSNFAICFSKEVSNDKNIYISFFDSINSSILHTYNVDNTSGNQSSCKLAYSDTPTSTIIVWQDDSSFDINQNDVYMQTYDENFDFGFKRIVSSYVLADQYNPGVVADSLGNIYVAWTDTRPVDGDDVVMDGNIYIQKFNSSGSSQWEKKVNTDSGNSEQGLPSIAVDSDNNIYVAWTDERNLDRDIYVQKFNSSGVKLYSKDLRGNINTGSSLQEASGMAIGSDYPVIVWSDNRDGYNYDIYFTKFIGYDNPVIFPNVNVGIHSTKRIGDNPVVYKHNSTINSGSSGSYNYIAEWDVPGYSINVSGHTLIMSDPSENIEVLPGQTRELMIYLQ